MSSNAFAACEREYNAQQHHIEVSRDERARIIDQRAVEQLQREALADALRLERAMNGPTPLEIAQQRIADLEVQRDGIYRDIKEWLDSFQPYFPGAVTLHDVYKGIEAMETKIAAYEAREKWLNERCYYAEWRDKEGRNAQQQGTNDGYWGEKEMGEFFSFSEFIEQTIREGK